MLDGTQEKRNIDRRSNLLSLSKGAVRKRGVGGWGHKREVKCWSLGRVWLFATPWTVARQVPLSMEFFSGKNTGVGSHFLLQRIFPTQVSHTAGRFFTS